MSTQLDNATKEIEVTDKSNVTSISITDDEIKNHLNDLRVSAENYQNDRSTKRQEWYKQYRAKPYGNEREGWSQTVKSVIWDVVQGSIPGLLEIFTGDFFTLKSKDGNNADNLQQLIKYQMLVKNEGEEQLDAWIQNCLIYEFGVLKTYFTNEYKTQTETIDEEIDEATFTALSEEFIVSKYTPVEYDLGDGQVITRYKNIKVVKKDVVYSGPIMENIPPWEFYITPGSTDVDTAPYVAHWVKRNLDYIKRREAAGIYRKGSLAKIKDALGNTTSDAGNILDEVNSLYEGDNSGNYSDTQSYPDKKEALPASEVFIKEEYVKLDLDCDGLLENAIIVSCNDIILSVSENPYKRPPFRLGRINPEPHKITGIPFTEILENDQKVQTNIIRFIQDGTAMSTWKNPITDDPQMRAALDRRKPFDTIMGNPNKIGWFDAPAPSQAAFNFMEFAQGMVENKTGVTRYNQGLDANSLNKTATGIQMITSASQQKQKLIAKRLGRVLSQVVRDFIFINQTWPPTNVIDIVGTNYKINPDDLRGEYTVNVVIGIGPQDKAFIVGQIDQFLAMAVNGPLLQMGLTDLQKVREAIEYKGRLQEIPYERFMFSEQEIAQGQNQGITQLNGQMQQMSQQMQMLQQENASLKQKTQGIDKLQLEAQFKQSEMQLEEAKIQMEMNLELKKAEMKLAVEKEIALMKMNHEREMELLKNQVNINVVSPA